MKVKGALISQMSGKLGGVVAATTKGGVQILRRRPNAKQVGTALQNVIRASLAVLSNTWGTILTAAQRQAWNFYAANVTKLNNQGDQIRVSGQNWFVGNNIVRAQSNAILGTTLTLCNDAPVIQDIGNPTTLEGQTTVDLNPATGIGTLTLAAGVMPLTTVAGDRLLLWASRPYGAGRANPQGGNQLIAGCSGTVTANTLSFTLTGGMIPGGSLTQQDYVLRLSRADGRLSSPFPVKGYPGN